MIQQSTSNSVTRHEHNGELTKIAKHQRRDSRESSNEVNTWDKFSVAELSADRIDHMTCDELIQVVRAADFPALFRTDLGRRLEFLDRDVLIRLAFLARQCCRNQGY